MGLREGATQRQQADGATQRPRSENQHDGIEGRRQRSRNRRTSGQSLLSQFLRNGYGGSRQSSESGFFHGAPNTFDGDSRFARDILKPVRYWWQYFQVCRTEGGRGFRID
jgi:hypothetical protein